MADQSTPDTPQSHQCGFIAQAVRHIEKLKVSVIGGEIGEVGKETIRCFKLEGRIYIRSENNTRAK